VRVRASPALNGQACATKRPETECDKCRQELATEGEPKPAPALHPNLRELYRQKVAKLEEALNDPLTSAEAAGAIRTLIAAVVLHPGEHRGEVRAELCGELAALLEPGQDQKAQTRARGGSAGLFGCGERI
jgi:hypothetical protein